MRETKASLQISARQATVPMELEEQSPLDFVLQSFSLHRRLASLIESSSGEFGLTASEALSLHCLSRRSEPVSEIAKQVGLQANGASVLVSRLVARGLVRRQRSRADRRVTAITLTKSGRSLAATIQLKLWHDLDGFLSPVDPSEQQQLFKLMRLLV